MGMFKSASNFITGCFDQASAMVESTGKAASMATTYVDNRAAKFKVVDRQLVLNDMTEELAPIHKKLDEDENYKDLYEQMAKEFDLALKG